MWPPTRQAVTTEKEMYRREVEAMTRKDRRMSQHIVAQGRAAKSGALGLQAHADALERQVAELQTEAKQAALASIERDKAEHAMEEQLKEEQKGRRAAQERVAFLEQALAREKAKPAARPLSAKLNGGSSGGAYGRSGSGGSGSGDGVSREPSGQGDRPVSGGGESGHRVRVATGANPELRARDRTIHELRDKVTESELLVSHLTRKVTPPRGAIA